MGILPTIERLFGITTGMTLAELRDPKQPLLRQLQQKAPGTYNHSLQVANIAEAAAEAIGADGLLVYVGALYHDVGKMNKPEYFIENQIDGYNKHEKLSPAMSLLVIVGHVKDGIELAREYNLPRPIIHFVESHHGTTLVEYFYHAARTQAAEEPDKETVEEVRFRYPGPKPHTKEAAILMLSDAVESATRAMKEPNPSRIESLVREVVAQAHARRPVRFVRSDVSRIDADRRCYYFPRVRDSSRAHQLSVNEQDHGSDVASATEHADLAASVRKRRGAHETPPLRGLRGGFGPLKGGFGPDNDNHDSSSATRKTLRWALLMGSVLIDTSGCQ